MAMDDNRPLWAIGRAGCASAVVPGCRGRSLQGGPADLATVAARFGAALRAEGVAVGPEQCDRFARAIQLVAPATTGQLYRCALATLVAGPAEVPVLERVFRLVFGGLTDPAAHRGQPTGTVPAVTPTDHEQGLREHSPAQDRRNWGAAAGGVAGVDRPGDRPARQTSYPALAAVAERLANRDFAALSADELAALVALMRRLRLAPPPRRSRRTVLGARGAAVDLRATLRQARRTGGLPVRLYRRQRRQRPRRLVVLCDISGSMEPYARAVLQLLYSATGAAGGTEVFTFATRLTRLTGQLRRVTPAVALERAGRIAPDWSGGTRIGAALKEFVDRYGARGMARGAVVVIVSDGWESGDPAGVARQLGRLARLAYRIVWANPRTASPRYRPLAGGMAAAWPYCDAVVSAHHLAALDDLLAAISAPGRRLPQPLARDPGPG